MNCSSEQCPVCGGVLNRAGPRYTIDELFELWHPVRFSAKTKQEHAEQSPFTQLHRCRTCSLGIFLPQIIGRPSFYTEAYNLDGSQATSDFTYSEEKWDFVEGLRDARPGEQVLEIGAGPGHFLSMVRDRGCAVVAVEPNESAARTARNRGFTVHASLDPLLETAARFDCIFAFHLIEHLENPMNYLASLRRLLKPTGRIGIAVPNQDGPIRFIDPCVQDMPPHHATRWSCRTFEFAARKIGLDIRRFALEPLTPENVYYYSLYVPRRLFQGYSRLGTAGARAASVVLDASIRAYLRLLRRWGHSSSNLLPGQALYVLLVAQPAGPSPNG